MVSASREGAPGKAALGVLATVQIVPAAANPHQLGAFTIATVDGTDVAYVQSAVQGIVTTDKKDLVRLNDVWESVRSQVLPVGMSADLIRRTVEERWTSRSSTGVSPGEAVQIKAIASKSP
jgi:hypothetical protein